jgi:hypothetical protein
MELYDLDNYHRMLEVDRALSVDYIKNMLEVNEGQNFDTDKAWVQNVILKTYGMFSSIPDPAAEACFRGVMLALSNSS